MNSASVWRDWMIPGASAPSCLRRLMSRSKARASSARRKLRDSFRPGSVHLSSNCLPRRRTLFRPSLPSPAVARRSPHRRSGRTGTPCSGLRGLLGLDGVGLGELPALRAPEPFSPRTPHSVRVAWAAADIERAGHQWIASREMALAPGRWGARVANERGSHSHRLPDLAFWPAGDNELHIAVVVVQGQSNPRRERAALEGWRASIAAERYAQVRYLAGPAAASHLRRVATEIGPTAPQFIAGEGVMADEPPVLLRSLRTSTRCRWPSRRPRWPLPISRDSHRSTLTHRAQQRRSPQRRLSGQPNTRS